MNKALPTFFCIQILFIVYFIKCKVYAGDLTKQKAKLNALIEILHSMYKDAFDNEKTYITRRLFTKDGNSHYTLHVQKLKEIDGVKIHNLRLEGKSKREDPIVYINNPVEARMPNPFLSIDQFKKAMFERVEKQKREFDVNRNIIINANNQFKVFKHLENFPTQIFDVKMHVKQVVDSLSTKKSTDILMKTTLHKRTHKENKKRKQNIHARSTTESTNSSDELVGIRPHRVNKKRKQKNHVGHRKPNVITATDLPKVPATKTETVAEEEITTASTADEETTTKRTANEAINTETMADEKITTETTADDGIITETIAETTAAEEINTEKIVIKEITTEIIAQEEIITEPVTTTEPTVRTTRTKQLRPFVFVGDR